MDLKEGVGVEWETGRLVTFVRNIIRFLKHRFHIKRCISL
jgi:hypothetical protein